MGETRTRSGRAAVDTKVGICVRCDGWREVGCLDGRMHASIRKSKRQTVAHMTTADFQKLKYCSCEAQS